MATVTKKLSLDVSRKNLLPNIIAKQYDTDSRFLTVQLLDDGRDLKVEAGSTVIISFRRADGKAKSFSGNANEDGTVTVPLANWALELDDIVECDISVYQGEAKLSTTTFRLEVQPAANGSGDISEDEDYDILKQLIVEVQTATEGANSAASAAEKWGHVTATAEGLSPGSDPTVALEETEDGKKFKFGIPKGEKGEKGDPGTISGVKLNGTPLVPDEAGVVDIEAYNEDNKPEDLEPTADNFEGILPVKKGGTGNETGYLPIIQLGTNIPEIEKTNPKTGIYNVEGRPLPNTLTEFYYRVIVLGDHQQTPAGYSTEIIVPYDGGNTRHIIVRTSDSKQWNSPRTLAYTDDLPKTIFDIYPDGIMHRNLFRGKNLGDRVTDEQLAAIKDGSFKDLFIGDYWAINNVNWLIADMDYFYQAGNTAFTKHHLVIIPQAPLYSAAMNTENTTAGGYVGSEMYTKNLEEAKTKIKAAFGDMVQTHRDILINTATEGRPSGYIWTYSEVELMTEVMVYGTYHYAVMNPGSYLPAKYTTARQQFAIFALNPYYAFIGRTWYWLRDVVSATSFAICGSVGAVTYYSALSSAGVRPYFCIGSNDSDADMPVEGPEIMGDEYTEDETAETGSLTDEAAYSEPANAQPADAEKIEKEES